MKSLRRVSQMSRSRGGWTFRMFVLEKARRALPNAVWISLKKRQPKVAMC